MSSVPKKHYRSYKLPGEVRNPNVIKPEYLYFQTDRENASVVCNYWRRWRGGEEFDHAGPDGGEYVPASLDTIYIDYCKAWDKATHAVENDPEKKYVTSKTKRNLNPMTHRDFISVLDDINEDYLFEPEQLPTHPVLSPLWTMPPHNRYNKYEYIPPHSELARASRDDLFIKLIHKDIANAIIKAMR
jgi:hypothetical protein